MSAPSRVGVVGCGSVGSGAAEVFARAGLDVVVSVPARASAQRGQTRIVRSLDRAVSKSAMTEAQRDEALARIRFETDLVAMADRHLVLEAVPEDESIKCDVLAAVDKILTDPAAILASATSAIPIARLARACERPGQVVGMHFFTPVPALPLVEIVGSVLTDERTCQRAEYFAAEVLGKQTIRSADRAGFVVNGLLVPYLLAAVRMVESGFATPQVVDLGMTLGCAHPVGPLRLADLIGLDTVAAVGAALYAEFKEPLYSPPPLLMRMVEAAMLGKKSGRGFYEYHADPHQDPDRSEL